MFESPQAGLSKDPPCIIVYLEFSCGVIERSMFCLESQKRYNLFLSEQGGRKKKSKTNVFYEVSETPVLQVQGIGTLKGNESGGEPKPRGKMGIKTSK